MTRQSLSSSSPDETRRLRSTLKEKKRNIEINDAFEKLQRQLPHVPSSTRLPKIKTLRLALKYIEHLNTILSGDKQIRNSYTERARSEECANGNASLVTSSSPTTSMEYCHPPAHHLLTTRPLLNPTIFLPYSYHSNHPIPNTTRTTTGHHSRNIAFV
ncbi:Helix-loop-helix DNA-binding domain protein [Cooperia oncophora]